MLKGILLVILISMKVYPITGQQDKLYVTKNGTINFSSNAPFEIIKASSKELQGVLDLEKKNFAFKVKMNSFEGFNSSLQREHFNENYIESSKYPEATFQGKIIEDIDFTKDGTYSVRAKGNFYIHGVSQERIIKSDVTVRNGKILVQSAFSVLLGDHSIPIPKVVKDKLSSEINVLVKCQLEPR